VMGPLLVHVVLPILQTFFSIVNYSFTDKVLSHMIF
jgi:hypothetical protein